MRKSEAGDRKCRGRSIWSDEDESVTVRKQQWRISNVR